MYAKAKVSIPENRLPDACIRQAEFRDVNAPASLKTRRVFRLCRSVKQAMHI